jgi:outer membrane protein
MNIEEKSWRNPMKKALIAILLLWMPWSFVFSAEPAEGRELSLRDAIYIALENNLSLQVQKSQTRKARLDLRFNKAQPYLPTLGLATRYSKSKRPSTDLRDGVEIVENEILTWNTSISQRIPLGGIFTATLSNQRQETNRINFPFNPLLITAGTVSYSQPLLKNFGTLATNYQIYSAANDYKISKYQLEEAVVNLVYEVESAYWELVYAHQNLEANKTALSRARNLVRQNEIKVKVGTAAPIEILSSKANEARNESAVIQAEQAIQTREEALKRILNMSKEPFTIIPKDKPEIKQITPEADDFLSEALVNRADIKRLRMALEDSDLTVKYQKNQSLPSLRLIGELTSYGVGGTVWGATTPNPFDPDFERYIIQKISFSQTIKDLFKLENNFLSISLNLQIPIPFTAEKARLSRARIQRESALYELKDLENTIHSEVSDVIRQLESNLKLVEADRIALELERENLKAEEKKLAVGLSTNFEVLQYQQQFADAQTSLLRSTIDYALTTARVNQVLNRTLRIYNINFDRILGDKIVRQ